MKNPEASGFGIFYQAQDRSIQMTQPPSSKDPASEINLQRAVFSQLLMGPSYIEVAAVLLRDALKKQYPTLDLDPNTTVIGEPAWDIIDGEIVELPTRYETLSDRLAEQVVKSDPVLLIDGLHFLSRLPLSRPDVHLPVRIEQIGCLINELTPAIFAAGQEQQLKFWNALSDNSGPRWHYLSETLQNIWNVTEVNGWTETECDMARELFLHPTLQDRENNSRYGTQAYLIDIKAITDYGTGRHRANALVVLTGTIDGAEVILTHSMLNGYEKFDSRSALEQSLADHAYPKPDYKMQWRFFEPSENIFAYAACAIISSQIEIIGDPGIAKMSAPDETESPDGSRSVDLEWFKNKLPDWLTTASASDQNMFAEHLKKLSELNGSQAGKTYLDDIPSIKSFVLSALKTQMQSQHADASTLDLETIEIQISNVVVWGSFVVPGKIETTRFSLVELALQNLIAVPVGDKIVRSLDGKELPDWMTVAFIENVITTIDIGRTYPQWVKSKLLDDPLESKRREHLYTSQLRIQLPMLALESQLRGQGGIDERGYCYVAALMKPDEADRKVDGQPIVLRQLAFVPELQLGNTQDIVANMFVIGPQDSNAGPCLLYRPLLEPQLCQYPSFSNLLYDIRQTASLRQSVLAWLPKEVHNSYSRYIFPGPLPSPWSIVEFVTNPLAAISNSGPISLSNETLGSDFLPLLFKANATALVELADRQSVSNSESRWESFRQAGWVIFNLALPYLGTTVGNAFWLWQILDDLETLSQSDETVGAQARWQVITDLLCNIALATTTFSLDRARTAGREHPAEASELVRELESLAKPKPELIIEKLAPVKQKLAAIEHYDTLRTSGALISRSREGARLLEPLSVGKPQNPGQPKSAGPLKGLYEQGGKLYVELAGIWFQVLADGEQVAIVDGNDHTRAGPLLMSDTQGQWDIDTRLRLRGAGSASIVRKINAEASRRNVKAYEELNRLEVRRLENQELLTMHSRRLKEASGPSRDASREVYLSALKTQRESYDEALQLLLDWPISQSRPDSTRTRLGYLNAQINFTFAEIDTLGEQFTPVMQAATEMITSGVKILEQHHANTAYSLLQLGNEMIERLDYMETRFSRLKRLGREGFEFVRQHRKMMPVYKSDDLRLYQLDMYRHLCLSLDSVNTVPEAWADINQMVDNSTVAFQSLRDAIDERSVIRLDEQINALGSLTEQFTAIEDHVKYVADEYREHARLAQLNRLKHQVGLMKKRALRHLALALDERSTRRSTPAPYQERPRPRRKFIRARFWGLVSVEPRLSELYEETDLADVKKPFSDEIIVTFHHKKTGEWVQHINPDAPPQPTPTLTTSIAKGQALIDGLPAFKAQVEESKKQSGRTPAGVGMVINAHARRMDTISVAIKTVLDQVQSAGTNETTEISPAEKTQRRTAESLRVELEKETLALYALGFDTEQQAIKQSPPTMSNILWLKERNQIVITGKKKRQRVKSAHYLDRYEIRDRADRKTLWFADFHYSRSWTPEHAFLSGHLKTPEQVASGKPVVPPQRLSQSQLIDLYRSEIDVEQAKAVFFPAVRS
jgi:hypothetical protein